MQLGSANNLFLLALVEAIAVGFVWLAFWRRGASVRFGGQRAVSAGGGSYWLRAALVVVAASLAVVAMARPQWGSREFSREEQGFDVVIVLDISQSMTAKDVQPTRLAAAQQDLERLVESIRGNRIGLVFFAGTAILRSPLSTDVEALTQIINRADKEPGLTRAGSDLGAALEQAGRILDASESPGKAVLIVSDGEDHVGAAATKAAELNQRGIVVFAAGVGTPQGSTLQDLVGRTGQLQTKVDAQGRPVITRLEEGKMQAIASAGGGRYVRIDAAGGLASLRDDLNRLEETPLSEQTQRVPIERLQIFVAAALAVLALAWFVPERLPRVAWRRLPVLRPHPGLALLIVATVIGGACAEDDAFRARNEAANGLFAAGQFQEALQAYESLLAERPDLPEVAYNTGNALHRLGDFERAVQETRRALPPSMIKLGVSTFYALGLHYMGLNDLVSAYESFKSALLLNPSDADAKWNLEVVLLLMNQRRQPEQPSGQQPQGSEQGEQPQQAGGEQPGMEQPQGGQPQPGQPASGQAQPSAAELRRALAEALAGLDQELSFEEAVEILELLQQLREQPRLAPGGTQPGGLDY